MTQAHRQDRPSEGLPIVCHLPTILTMARDLPAQAIVNPSVRIDLSSYFTVACGVALICGRIATSRSVVK